VSVVWEILEWPRRSLTSRAGSLSVNSVATVRRRVYGANQSPRRNLP
jgi:hypothetical protein